MKKLTLLLMLGLLLSCRTPPPKPLEDRLDPNNVEVVYKWRETTQIVIRNLSWVQTFLVIGAVGGIAAAFLGVQKLGITVLLCCIFSYGLTTALKIIETTYSTTLALVLLVFGIVILLYAIWMNRTALREIVVGGELFKKQALGTSVTLLREAYNKTQKHQSTRKVVEGIQNTISRKEKKNVAAPITEN